MPYTYNNIQIDQVYSDNTVIQNIGTFTAATIPALTDSFAIGNRIKMTLTIDASGAETFTAKILRINLGLFTLNPNNSFLNAYDYGFQSNGILTTTPTAAVFNAPSDTQLNISCLMSMNAGATTATVVIYFYVTNDLNRYLGNQPNATIFNINRFISTSTTGVFLNNNPNTVYRQTKNISFAANVSDFAAFNQNVIEPLGAAPYLNIPVRVRWYNTDYLGITTGMRYINSLEITSPSQIAAGLPSLTDATATAAQANNNSDVRAIFTVNGNSLSVNEDNSVTVLISGDAYVGSAGNDPVLGVRALLFRIDDVTNTADFVSEYDLSDAKITAGVVASAQIDNAIWSPCDFFEDVPNPDDVQVEFVIKGSKLTLNGSYYLVINLYDSVNADYVTTHISPELTADYTSPAIPTITGYLSTYNKEYTGNELTVSPHQRIKGSIVVDKTSYETALSAMGITADFDDCLAGVICKLQNTTGVVNQVQVYIPNTLTPPANNAVLTPEMTLVTDSATTLRLECIFRIAEEYAGGSTNIEWTLSFNQPINTIGGTDFIQIQYLQKLSVDVFENDNGTPNLLNVRFYDLDLYLAGTKQEIIDICDADQIIAEVEKDPAFTGSINLVATIYPATESGDTNTNSIQEEEEWSPITVQMSQAVSGKLDNVETGFGGDDFATFRINCQQLTRGQRYWVTAIAYEQFPDYCPLGFVSVINGSTAWDGTAFGWRFTADATAFINDIIAHPDYVSGVTITEHKLTDAADNLVGALQSAVGNTLTVYVIDTNQTEVYYTLVVDAVFNSGSGNHLVRHVLRNTINRPIFNGGPVAYLMTGYECTDLG